MDRISVIIPIYNGESFAEETLRGVLAQSYLHTEILCVDDGSTDGTPALLERLAAEDGRVKVLREENRGAGAARNLGLAAATGDYVVFLDADDVYYPDMLRTLLRAAKRHRADIVMCRFRQVNFRTGEDTLGGWGLIEEKKPFSVAVRPEYLTRLTHRVTDRMYRRLFLEENSLRFAEIRVSNDTLFAEKSMLLAKRIVCVSDVLFEVRKFFNNGSITSNRAKHLPDSAATLCELLRWAGTQSFSVSVLDYLGESVINSVLYNSRYGHGEEFRAGVRGVIDEMRGMAPFSGFSRFGMKQRFYVDELNLHNYWAAARERMLLLAGDEAAQAAQCSWDENQRVNMRAIADYIDEVFPPATDGEEAAFCAARERLPAEDIADVALFAGSAGELVAAGEAVAALKAARPEELCLSVYVLCCPEDVQTARTLREGEEPGVEIHAVPCLGAAETDLPYALPFLERVILLCGVPRDAAALFALWNKKTMAPCGGGIWLPGGEAVLLHLQRMREQGPIIDEAMALRRENRELKSSLSYRLGRGITWLPRKIRGFFVCLCDNGAAYTLDRVLVHLGLHREEEAE